MKVLTLTQPWASLVDIGAKTVETRSWRTRYRGEIAIHAAKGFPAACKKLVTDDWMFYTAFRPAMAAHLRHCGVRLIPSECGRECLGTLPVGAIIATARIVDCLPTEEIVGALPLREQAFGDYAPGRFAWILSNVKQIREPIPAKGALGLWNWEGQL